MLSGTLLKAEGGNLTIDIPACSGDIWVPAGICEEPLKTDSNVAVPEEPVQEDKEEVPAEEQIPVKPECAEEKPETVSVISEPEKSDEKPAEEKTETPEKLDLNKPYEEMSVAELQACILEKMAKNGPVTDRMRKDVEENIYPNSLLNWVKSFR